MPSTLKPQLLHSKDLDEEWLLLFQSAKDMGISIEQVRLFILEFSKADQK